jgi:hypothetical protein
VLARVVNTPLPAGRQACHYTYPARPLSRGELKTQR